MLIREAHKKDIEALASIHFSTLKNGILGKLGFSFLKKVFYPLCFDLSDVLILVTEKNDTVTSFVIYTTSAEKLTQPLLQKKRAIFSAFLKSFFKKPSILFDFLSFLILSPKQSIHIDQFSLKNAPEIYFIATNPSYQKQGFAAMLVQEGLTLFGKKFGLDFCIVKTFSEYAETFYLKNDFTHIGEEQRGKKRLKIFKKSTNTSP